VETVEFGEAVRVQGRSVKDLELAREAVASSAIVNLAKFKTHGLMGLTLAVKNLFGTVPGFRKSGWHLKTGDDRTAFARLLVEIAAALPAGLHVLDAVVAMEGNGPGSGTPRPLGALLASPDPVALDRVACELVGFPAREMGIFEAAAAIGFGEPDLARIEILGDDPRALAVKGFAPAAHGGSPFRTFPVPRLLVRALRRVFAPAPAADARLCRSCGLCVKVCPAGAVRLRAGGGPRFDRERCVRCLCCQEICPEGAIRVRRRFSL
jgi:Pyruvate/2-oxoacid:ferredoxin oxidoreductase delta subunit